jgi:hypothetical protein
MLVLTLAPIVLVLVFFVLKVRKEHPSLQKVHRAIDLFAKLLAVWIGLAAFNFFTETLQPRILMSSVVTQGPNPTAYITELQNRGLWVFPIDLPDLPSWDPSFSTAVLGQSTIAPTYSLGALLGVTPTPAQETTPATTPPSPSICLGPLPPEVADIIEVGWPPPSTPPALVQYIAQLCQVPASDRYVALRTYIDLQVAEWLLRLENVGTVPGHITLRLPQGMTFTGCSDPDLIDAQSSPPLLPTAMQGIIRATPTPEPWPAHANTTSFTLDPGGVIYFRAEDPAHRPLPLSDLWDISSSIELQTHNQDPIRAPNWVVPALAWLTCGLYALLFFRYTDRP